MSSSFHVSERARRVELYRQQMTVTSPISMGFVEIKGTDPNTGELLPQCSGIIYEPFEQRFTAPSRRVKMSAIMGGQNDRSNRED